MMSTRRRDANVSSDDDRDRDNRTSSPGSATFLVQQQPHTQDTIPRRLRRTLSELIEGPAPRSFPPTTPPPGSPKDSVELVQSPVQSPDPLPRQSSNESQADSQSPRRRRPKPFIKRLKPQLVLENAGSVARDHLASERTFLAYVRTSLSIASVGVGLVQLFSIAVNTDSNNVSRFTAITRQMQVYARPLGATTVAFALVVLGIGCTRYFTIQSALTKGKFPVARLTVFGISFVMGLIVVIVFAILVSEKKA